MGKGDLTNIWLLIGLLMMLIVFVSLWMIQNGGLGIIEPFIEETPVLTGIVLTRRMK